MVTDIRGRQVYDAPSAEDGRSVLVDRVWPRGLRKDASRPAIWETAGKSRMTVEITGLVDIFSDGRLPGQAVADDGDEEQQHDLAENPRIGVHPVAHRRRG
jgi:hypothetical protein